MTLDTAWLDRPRALVKRARTAFDSRVLRERLLMLGVAEIGRASCRERVCYPV